MRLVRLLWCCRRDALSGWKPRPWQPLYNYSNRLLRESVTSFVTQGPLWVWPEGGGAKTLISSLGYDLLESFSQHHKFLEGPCKAVDCCAMMFLDVHLELIGVWYIALLSLQVNPNLEVWDILHASTWMLVQGKPPRKTPKIRKIENEEVIRRQNPELGVEYKLMPSLTNGNPHVQIMWTFNL